MPLYEYHCLSCVAVFTQRKSFQQAQEVAVCTCGSQETRKVLGQVAFMVEGGSAARPASIPVEMASGGGCGCGHCTCQH